MFQVRVGDRFKEVNKDVIIRFDRRGANDSNVGFCLVNQKSGLVYPITVKNADNVRSTEIIHEARKYKLEIIPLL